MAQCSRGRHRNKGRMPTTLCPTTAATPQNNLKSQDVLPSSSCPRDPCCLELSNSSPFRTFSFLKKANLLTKPMQSAETTPGGPALFPESIGGSCCQIELRSRLPYKERDLENENFMFFLLQSPGISGINCCILVSSWLGRRKFVSFHVFVCARPVIELGKKRQ